MCEVCQNVGPNPYLCKILLRVLVTARLANVRTPEVSILHCTEVYTTLRCVTSEKGEYCVDTVVSRCLQDKLIQALASLRGIEMYVRQIIVDCKVWQTALQTSNKHWWTTFLPQNGLIAGRFSTA